MILRPHLLDHQLHGLLDQRQLVGTLHGTGDIQQEHQIAGRQLRQWHFEALQAHLQQPALLVPGRQRQFGVDAEGLLAAVRGRIGIVKIVDEFLDAHGIGGRQLALVEKTTHIAVGAGIDINGEGGHRLLAGGDHRIRRDVGIAFGVGGLAHASPVLRPIGQIRRCRGHRTHRDGRLRHHWSGGLCFLRLQRTRPGHRFLLGQQDVTGIRFGLILAQLGAVLSGSLGRGTVAGAGAEGERGSHGQYQGQRTKTEFHGGSFGSGPAATGRVDPRNAPMRAMGLSRYIDTAQRSFSVCGLR